MNDPVNPEYERKLENLKAMLLEGIRQAERGEYAPLSLDELLTSLNKSDSKPLDR